MTPQTLAATALAVAVVVAGTAAAVPAIDTGEVQLDDQASAPEQADEAPGGGEDDDRGPGNASDRGSESDRENVTSDRRGPPATMPDPVPGFVSDIHDRIGESVGRATDGLGEAIASIASGNRSADGNGGSASESDEHPSDWSHSADDDRSENRTSTAGTDPVEASPTAQPGPQGDSPGSVPGIVRELLEVVPVIGDGPVPGAAASTR